MKTPITYRVQVWDHERTPIEDCGYTTKWTMNQLVAFLKRKHHDKWKRIYLTVDDSRDFYNANKVD
jgi:hypothetical protein